jgi:hypothetical protein
LDENVQRKKKRHPKQLKKKRNLKQQLLLKMKLLR